MPFILPNGIGFTGGGSLGTARPLYTTGVVVYVSSVTGNASNTGLDRSHPVTTTALALSAIGATDDGIVAYLSDHREEIATELAITQRTNFCGEGFVSGRPSVEITLAAGTHDFLSFGSAAGNGSRIENIRFRPPGNAASPAGTTGGYLIASADNITVDGCDFEVDEHTNTGGVILSTGANGWRFNNCIFTNVETSTDPANKPRPGLVTGGAITGLELEGCTFDAGTVGFNTFGFDATAGIITDLRVRGGLSLLRGADFALAASTPGYVGGPFVVTGSGRIVFP